MGASIDSLDVLVTAEEAFPALERLFLGAEREIIASFRVFDFATSLRSDEARAVGKTWGDLVRHTLDRGVRIRMSLTDFDPILATRLHRKSWRSAKQAAAVAELSRAGDLDFRVMHHPARAGLLPRFAFRRKIRERLRRCERDQLTPGLQDIEGSALFDLIPATHHQKLAVFDRATLFIGGLDLDERRYDTKRHERPAEETWHDVQVIVTGKVVLDAQRHLESFQAVAAGARPAPEVSDGFLRTLSARRGIAPFHISPRRVCSEIEDAHLRAIRRARGLIYIETQFLRHLPLAAALGEAGACDPDLGLIAVLPAAPEDVAFDGNRGADAQLGEYLQAECIDTIREGFGRRALFCAPAQRRPDEGAKERATLEGAPIIYVHAKVSVFGDTEAIVSSANLNGRSMCWDTEAGVRIEDPAMVRTLRERLWQHWMPETRFEKGLSAPERVEAWRREVLENRRAAPADRRIFLLPYRLDEARALGQPVPVVPNELV